MSEAPHTGEGTGDAHDGTIGYEGYPFASVEAEQRIKLITTLISIVAVGMLLAGLYLALFTPNVGVGGILSLVGFLDLMVVPFIAKRLRRTALAREGGGTG